MKIFEPHDRVVAVVAHPDDAELMFYGTLRVARSAGAAVTVLVVTRGENGVSQADAAARKIEDDQRFDETDAALSGAGIAVLALDFPDGNVAFGRHLVNAIETTLRGESCTVLLTHDSLATNDHQDHLAVAKAAANVGWRLQSCRTILVGETTQSGSGFEPNMFVDVSPFLLDKIKALAAHESQIGRSYISPDHVRWRGASGGWRSSPADAMAGMSFESLRLVVATDPGAAK